jgi:dienelactone hydrolase
MIIPRLAILRVVAARLALASACGVAAAFVNHAAASDMVRDFLLGLVDEAQAVHRQEWESLTTPDAIAARRARLTTAWRDAIGPLPARVPLDPRVTGRLHKPGYFVEKIIFTSQPGIFVTALLFLPEADRFPRPWPAVVVACGHAEVGKGYPAYQRAAALLATHGIAALLVDPIGQGERRQFVDAHGTSDCGGCLGEHNAVGAACIPLGRNLIAWMAWDGIRGLDYLASRPDVRGDRLGCMGNSGGGTQASAVMILDDRVRAAAVSCYLTSLYGQLPRTIGPQDAEQNVFGQLAFGMDHVDCLLLRAPRPTLVCGATRDFFDIGDTRRAVANARRIYGQLDAAAHLGFVEDDAEHGFTRPLREAACQFMLRWLADRDETITEMESLAVLTPDESICTPTGSVLDLPDSRTFADLTAGEAQRLAAQRNARGPLPPEALRAVARARSDMRSPAGDCPGRVEAEVISMRLHEGVRHEQLVVVADAGIRLPADLWTPATADARPPILSLDSAGRAAAAAHIRELVADGRRVMAVDLRGMGETAPTPQRYFDVTRHGVNGKDAFLAYLLGRSLVGMQADDIVACGRWLAQCSARGDAGPADGEKPHTSIELMATGLAVIPAAHAAAVHPELFPQPRYGNVPRSWTEYVVAGPLAERPLPLTSLIHGVLIDYDLPDLIALTTTQSAE